MDLASLVALVGASYAAAGRPARVLLALSGGADSVALLHVLARLREREGFALSAVHVHHGLRREADGDAAFVQALCADMHVAATVVRVRVAPGNLEAQARDVRYRALRAQAQAVGADVIALAHQADDQAETILMHWMRGAGAQGLAGMRECARGLWRPLLTVTRAEILAVLGEIGARWREDATNQDPALTRNALRLQVLPALRALRPGFETSVARAARLMAMEEDWADAQTRAWLGAHASLHPACPFLLTEPCQALMPALARRAVRLLCAQAGIEPDMDTTDRVTALLGQPRGSVNLPQGGRALRAGRRLYVLARARPPFPLGCLRMDDADGPLGEAGGRAQVMDMDEAQGAVLRFPRAGDRIAPLGMAGTQALGRYLAGRGVDAPMRALVPVLARGPDVLWAVGAGLSGRARVRADTARRVRLHYAGRLPWQTENEQWEDEGHGRAGDGDV